VKRKELLLRSSLWMQEAENSPVVMSSRIRLARNLENVPFPHSLSAERSEQVARIIAQVLDSVDVEGDRLTYLPLTELSPIELQVLIEKHLISADLANAKRERGVALTHDHRVAIMVNEEDHLRMQVLLPGDQLREAYRLADSLDDGIEERLDFAYREAQGYLTACPTNVGTGMRASVMVHLPALVMTNQVQHLLGTLTHLGLAVRGLYGEGSQALGHLFQVSNQITLGKSEEDIIAHLEAVTGQIVGMELQARENLLQQARLVLEDKVWRARGMLQNARLLSSADAMLYLSQDRLGTDLGILPKSGQTFAELLVDSNQGCLQYKLNRELDSQQRDEQRANQIRAAFAAANGR